MVEYDLRQTVDVFMREKSLAMVVARLYEEDRYRFVHKLTIIEAGNVLHEKVVRALKDAIVFERNSRNEFGRSDAAFMMEKVKSEKQNLVMFTFALMLVCSGHIVRLKNQPT